MLYASECDGSIDCARTNLVRIDPASGVRTFIGAIGFSIAGLAFDAREGVLYGIEVAHGEYLVRIDPRTGAGSVVGPAVYNCRGLAYDGGARRLFGTDPFSSYLLGFDLRSGAGSVLANTAERVSGFAGPIR